MCRGLALINPYPFFMPLAYLRRLSDKYCACGHGSSLLPVTARHGTVRAFLLITFTHEEEYTQGERYFQ